MMIFEMVITLMIIMLVTGLSSIVVTPFIVYHMGSSIMVNMIQMKPVQNSPRNGFEPVIYGIFSFKTALPEETN